MELGGAHWATRAGAPRHAAQPWVSRQHARHIGLLPDDRSGSAIFAWWSARRHHDRADQLSVLDRKGFTSIKNRAHRPFGHTYGALSRILGAIAQTEVMVLRCRVVGWTGRPPSRAGGQREPDGCSLRWFRPLLPSTDPGGPGEPSGALRRPPGAPPRPRPGGRTDGGRASESPGWERG